VHDDYTLRRSFLPSCSAANQDRDVKQSEGGSQARVRAPRGGRGSGPAGGRAGGGGRAERPEASSGLQVRTKGIKRRLNAMTKPWGPEG